MHPAYIKALEELKEKLHPTVYEKYKNGNLNVANAHCLTRKTHEKQLELLDKACNTEPKDFVPYNV